MSFKFFVVPAGTNASTCDAHRRGGTCDKIIYWITYERPDPKATTKRVKNPIDCSVEGGVTPSLNLRGVPPKDGRGVSHYQTCVDAGLFGPKKK